MTRSPSSWLTAAVILLVGLAIGWTAHVVSTDNNNDAVASDLRDSQIIDDLLDALPGAEVVPDASSSGDRPRATTQIAQIRTTADVIELANEAGSVLKEQLPQMAIDVSSVGAAGVRLSGAMIESGELTFVQLALSRLGDGEEGSRFLVTLVVFRS